MSSRNILVACSGSVATVKLHKLIEKLQEVFSDCSIKVILTEHSKHFTTTPERSDQLQTYTDEDEWETWKKMGDDVLHIELGRWAQVLLIAPLSANSLAKISTGICDNLLTCTVRAWDTSKPLLFAPAMNTRMLDHPVTRPQIDLLTSWGYTEIPTVEKTLACGDKGLGAMAEVDTIVSALAEKLT